MKSFNVYLSSTGEILFAGLQMPEARADSLSVHSPEGHFPAFWLPEILPSIYVTRDSLVFILEN